MKKERRHVITTEPLLRSDYADKNGLRTLMLKVTACRRTKYYCVKLENQNVRLSEDQFNEVLSIRPKGKAKEIREALDKSKTKGFRGDRNYYQRW